MASCNLCCRDKSRTHTKYRLLQSLNVPDRPWLSILMCHIDQLPQLGSYNAILVVVSRLTKMAHFVPTTTKTTSQDLACKYKDNIYRLHGAPKDIVSDRGSKFTSAFWRAFCKTTGVNQSLSTAYHPQSNGQTERVNQSLEQYLCIYTNCNQDDWAEHLSADKFIYNSSSQSLTTMTPFFANYGYEPTVVVALDKAVCTPFEADATRLHLIHKHCRIEIQKVISKSKEFANRHCQAGPTFEIGLKVWLSTANIKLAHPTCKMSEKRIGLYPIFGKTSRGLCRLGLPPEMSRLHPVFHVSQPELYKETPLLQRRQPPPGPVYVDNEAKYKVEGAVDSKVQAGKLMYKVQWKGYQGHDRYGWKPPSHLQHCANLVKSYHLCYPNPPSPSNVTEPLARKADGRAPEAGPPPAHQRRSARLGLNTARGTPPHLDEPPRTKPTPSTTAPSQAQRSAASGVNRVTPASGAFRRWGTPSL